MIEQELLRDHPECKRAKVIVNLFRGTEIESIVALLRERWSALRRGPIALPNRLRDIFGV